MVAVQRWARMASSARRAKYSARHAAPSSTRSLSADVSSTVSGARVLPERTVEVGATKWLALESLEYVDSMGNQRAWDRCVRRTRLSDDAVDAVAILAVLQEDGAPPKTILVKQFRPPVGSYTVELPAGLIDDGETPAEAAVRELHEETGLVAEVDDCALSSPLVLSPGLTNENVIVVTVPVDMGRPENHHDSVQQMLDDGRTLNSSRASFTIYEKPSSNCSTTMTYLYLLGFTCLPPVCLCSRSFDADDGCNCGNAMGRWWGKSPKVDRP